MDDMVTTYNARTFLQTQLNKAVRVSELQTSKLTDRNPKDLIIYPESDFVFMDHSLQRDNNGRGFFDDAPFPTLEFPSDHAFLTCELNLRRRICSDPEHMPWDEELPVCRGIERVRSSLTQLRLTVCCNRRRTHC